MHTTKAQSVLLNQCMHRQVWLWNVAPFQRPWGGCEWLDRHQMCVGKEEL